MNRKQFFKNAGLVLGTAMLSPQLIFSNESKPDKKLYCGIDYSRFKIKLSKRLKKGDFIYHNPPYNYNEPWGQKLMIIDSDNDFNHTVRLVTKNPHEYWINPVEYEDTMYLVAFSKEVEGYDVKTTVKLL